MAKFKSNIEALIKVNTKDDVVDWTNIDSVLNNDIDKYNSSKQPDMEALKIKHNAEYETTLFKGLEIEGVTNQDQFKSHVDTLKNSTDTNADLVTKLQGELDTKTKEYETMDEKFNNIKVDNAKVVFKLDIVEENFNPKYENMVQLEYQTLTKDLEQFDKKDIFAKIKENFPEFDKDYVAGVKNFGNKKPNDNKTPGFGGNKQTANGFYGNKVKPN
jgi:hypothetical protein